MTTDQPTWVLPRHLPQLDGLRGVACLFVLVHHYVTAVAGFGPASPFRFLSALSSQFLLSGVDLFFVLSGFLIGGILIDERRSATYFPTFYIRRACRILPVYGLLIGSFWLVLAIGGHAQWSRLADPLFAHPMAWWSYATFTQNFAMAGFGDSGALWPGVTWSLAVEEQFYLLFPLIVLFTPPRRLWLVSALVMVAAPLCRLALVHNHPFATYVLLPCRMDTLMVGVIVAQVCRDPGAIAWIGSKLVWLTLAIPAVGIVLALNAVGLMPLNMLRYTGLALFFGAIMLLVIIRPEGRLSGLLKGRFLRFTGMISYAVYMYHQVVNGLLHGLIFSRPPSLTGWPQIGVTLLAVAVTLLLAYASWRLMEHPIRALGRRFKYGDPIAT